MGNKGVETNRFFLGELEKEAKSKTIEALIAVKLRDEQRHLIPVRIDSKTIKLMTPKRYKKYEKQLKNKA